MSERNSSTNYNGGIGCGGLLAIIFIVMKLMGWGMVANWSWLWVLSPIWIPVAIVLLIFMVTALFLWVKHLKTR
jgi:hypothetical protein